ncbi:putative oxidoreductase ucpA [Amylocarpus encephaloides]|uniref:Oxidoreductase ucpA n=1 Tax=Amylocarpus encephaloides TaxID=45428 RepID=A0A9P7YPB8_9HELO|nr:putative oxidoreductase ucpA [Amylocarpus encephaloides]
MTALEEGSESCRPLHTTGGGFLYYKLSKKNIHITGAGKGIGHYAVVINARSLLALEEVTGEIYAINPNVEVLLLHIDFPDEFTIAASWAEIKEKYGHADVLETNIKGAFLMTHAFQQILPQDHPATIIAVFSTLAIATVPSLSSLSLSKFSILQLGAFITAECSNVTAVGIYPRIVHTNTVTKELKPFAHITFELAGVVEVRLATEKARFLSRRYVSSNWSVDEHTKEEIMSEGKLLVGIKGKFRVG